jgi:hypothetical protein
VAENLLQLAPQFVAVRWLLGQQGQQWHAHIWPPSGAQAVERLYRSPLTVT